MEMENTGVADEFQQTADAGQETTNETPGEESTAEETGVTADTGALDQPEGDAGPETDNAFYQRMQRERRKIEDEFAPLRQQNEVLARTAARYNMTPEQYTAALEQQAIIDEREALEAQGINYDALNQAVSNHPALRQAQQVLAQQEAQAAFNAEAAQLFAKFPDIKPEQVPKEVFDIKAQTGISLLDAYLRYDYDNARRNGEQEAVKKLRQGAATTPGALGGAAEHSQKAIDAMSKEDFERFKQEQFYKT